MKKALVLLSAIAWVILPLTQAFGVETNKAVVLQQRENDPPPEEEDDDCPCGDKVGRPGYTSPPAPPPEPPDPYPPEWMSDKYVPAPHLEKVKGVRVTRAPRPAVKPRAAVLPFTGISPNLWVAFALSLMVAGLLMIQAAERRRSSAIRN